MPNYYMLMAVDESSDSCNSDSPIWLLTYKKNEVNWINSYVIAAQTKVNQILYAQLKPK